MRKQKNSKAGGFIQFFNKFNNQNVNNKKHNNDEIEHNLRKNSPKLSKDDTQR